MRKVTLANSSGETKIVNIKFSWQYLLIGPLYLIYKNAILRGLLLTLLYILIICGGNEYLKNLFLGNLEVGKQIISILDFMSKFYWTLIGVLVIIHLLMAIITSRTVIKKLYKKGYVPFAEIDTQLLIKYNLASVGTLCYLSSFKAIDGVQGKIKMGNSKDLEKELEELKQLLKDGMLSKDEYETKRAMAIMRSSNK